MKLTKTAGVLLAVLLVATAGVTALPGNAPADSKAGQADGQYDDENAGNTPADAGPAMNDSDASEHAQAGEHAKDDADRRGPPTDMPEQVPDFVTQVHNLINQFIDGDIDNLGEQINGLIEDEHSHDDQTHDEQADDHAGDQPADDQTADDQTADDQTADDQTADDEHSHDDQTADDSDDTQDSEETPDDTTTATPTATPA